MWWPGGVCVEDFWQMRWVLVRPSRCSGVVVANPKPRTLIVLPRALLEQWRDAIVSSLHHQPLVWHGAGQRGMTAEELANLSHRANHIWHDLRSEPQESLLQQRIMLHKAEWDRVIYDEAHHLQER